MDDKIKVLITSVLKPVDDVRSCYKIGQSLAQTNKYEVNIIGFDSKKKYQHENIFLHPVFKFRRNSVKRLFAPFSVLKKFIKLKPKLIIVNTPELLWVMYLIKILFGTRIIYDIQENYRLNVKYSAVDNSITKIISLLFLYFTEGASKYFVSGYFLAEDCYINQLNFFHKKPYIKLLNKSVQPIQEIDKPIIIAEGMPIKFIYSGTIGESYGTIEAVDFCKQLYKLNPKITLIIVGYSSDYKYFKLLQKECENQSFIKLIANDSPIPQTEVIDQIKNSDVALLPYHLNYNIKGRFPTKIYDYLALGIPMIIPPHTRWKAFLEKYNAGICVNYQHPNNTATILKQLYATEYYRFRPKSEIQWKSQEATLEKFIDNVLSN
ncbi:glycosyltransferase [Marivirga harenae]|uniref:glycosyltransferase n=1 Tax=Marivirga harenae TaxID=2010992 RepID=UPI0026E0BFF1|nr:glycosyltransferase [Marivirga harenae]WKV11699.1 glycosyltransferase [Marivirga harenae]